MYSFLLAASSDFSTTVFPIIRWVFIGLIFVCAIVMIGAVLFQTSADENGPTVITGQESYYSQNKGNSKEGMLKKTTTVCSIIIALCTVLYFVSFLING